MTSHGPDLAELAGVFILLAGVFLIHVPVGLVLTGAALVFGANIADREETRPRR